MDSKLGVQSKSERKGVFSANANPGPGTYTGSTDNMTRTLTYGFGERTGLEDNRIRCKFPGPGSYTHRSVDLGSSSSSFQSKNKLAALTTFGGSKRNDPTRQWRGLPGVGE